MNRVISDHVTLCDKCGRAVHIIWLKDRGTMGVLRLCTICHEEQ